MLELPEVKTISRQIGETFIGKEIVEAQAAQSPHGFAWYWGEPADYPERLVGRKILGVTPAAGHLLIDAGDVEINFNDGINVRYLAPGTALPKKHQFYLGFDDGSSMVCTVQMYGGMQAYPKGALDDNMYYCAAKEKPDPLSDAFDMDYFMTIVEAAPQKLSTKGLLATEQRIPGFGNGCLQDVLFNARINPQTKLAALKDGDYDTLFAALKSTLKDMTDKGGRNIEKDLYGNPGGYQSILSSKTLSQPCPICYGGITRKAYMGGNVYYCPTCQPVVK